MIKPSEKGVTHWVDGSATWKLGISGFFLRVRGFITSSILVGLPLAGVPFWWPENLPNKIEVTTFSVIVSSLIVLLIVFIALPLYARYHTQKSLKMKAKLHHLVHDSRDAVSELFRRVDLNDRRSVRSMRTKRANKEPRHERKHLSDFSNRACETVADYFSTLLGDDTIGCAIRIGIADPLKSSDEIKYVTVGRSGVLNRGRSETSQPVPRSAGIPKFFLSDDVACKGILFYDDLDKAVANGAYLKTRNDEIYKDDIKTMVVAPLNGWNGVKADLIGLLYITSKTDHILKPKYVDLVKFTADHLALAYSSMFAQLYLTNSMPQLIGGIEDGHV